MKCCLNKKKKKSTENIIVIEPQQNPNPFTEFRTPPRKIFKKSKKLSPSEEEKTDLQGSSNKKLGLSDSEQPHFVNVKPFEFSLDLELSNIGVNLSSSLNEKKSQRYFFNVSPDEDETHGFSFPVRIDFLTKEKIKIYFPREIPKVKNHLFGNSLISHLDPTVIW